MNDSIILEARQLAFIDRVRPRSSKIWHLSDELFTEAVRAFMAGGSFAKIRVMLGESGIPDSDLPSQAAWVKFWSRYRPFLRLARRRAAADGANAFAAEARGTPADFDEGIFDLVRQLAFELIESDAANLREVSLLVRLLLKHRDQRLKERMVEVAERRVGLAERQAKGTTECTEDDAPRLTPEERERRIREIFEISDDEPLFSGSSTPKSGPDGRSEPDRRSEPDGRAERDGREGTDG